VHFEDGRTTLKKFCLRLLIGLRHVYTALQVKEQKRPQRTVRKRKSNVMVLAIPNLSHRELFCCLRKLPSQRGGQQY
jgi:hypothetical protein